MENKKTVDITFYGGTESPTGSNFMIEDGTTKILVDCGLRQGCQMCEEINRKPFAYDPKEIEALFVTHAHIDHIGRIPKLVKEGFSGPIYSTAPTKEIAELMLTDSAEMLFYEAREEGKEPIYTKEDVAQVMRQWKGIPYHEGVILGAFTTTLHDAGHILGSSMVRFTYNGKNILFTGDLGNAPSPLLPQAEALSDIDYMVMESVYGDRNHENRDVRLHLLEDIIEDTIERGGVLMIPAFSLERTQEIIFEMKRLLDEGRIPHVPIYIDSPLAIDVTKVYQKYERLFNKDAQDEIAKGSDIFSFPDIHFTYTREESMTINKVKPPKVIIAGSGMSNGGRIVHHESMYLDDPRNTLLVIGYQVPGSLGRQLVDGAKRVTIKEKAINVKARIANIRGYSAHMDSDHLLEFVDRMHDSLKEVFVVLGEPKSSSFLAQRIQDYLGIKARIPKLEEKVSLEL